MTDPQPDSPSPEPSASAPSSPTPSAPVTPPPPFDAAPYVPPRAPVYDAAGHQRVGDPSAYTPPAYPAVPTSYGSGAPQPVQTTPGAPPTFPGDHPGYGYAGYAYASPRRTNGLAVAAMVLSIVGFVWILPVAGGIAGAIMGHVALRQIAHTGESGRGMALAGVIVGWAGVALSALLLFLVFGSLAFWSSTGSYYS